MIYLVIGIFVVVAVSAFFRQQSQTKQNEQNSEDAAPVEARPFVEAVLRKMQGQTQTGKGQPNHIVYKNRENFIVECNFFHIFAPQYTTDKILHA